MRRVYSREGGPAIKIVLDITRLVEEGKLTAQEAERLQALARYHRRGCRFSEPRITAWT
jgi:hypothetical protein